MQYSVSLEFPKMFWVITKEYIDKNKFYILARGYKTRVKKQTKEIKC